MADFHKNSLEKLCRLCRKEIKTGKRFCKAKHCSDDSEVSEHYYILYVYIIYFIFIINLYTLNNV